MPTNRRRRRLERRIDLAEIDFHKCRHLTYGQPLMPANGYADMDSLATAWNLFADDILAAWIERFPGFRPFAWWAAVGVPEFGERLCRPDHGCDLAEWRQREFRFHFGILHTHTIAPIQEEEETYLRRHRLLMPGERQRIGEDWPFGDGPSIWDTHLKEVFEQAA